MARKLSVELRPGAAGQATIFQVMSIGITKHFDSCQNPSMAFATVNNMEITGSLGNLPLAPTTEESNKPRFKSFKKKFLKMRHKFKERMRENSRLYEEEQHCARMSRRLQEENDQYLDLLYDINESTKIPSQLCYDLRSPTPAASDVPALEPDIGPTERQDIEGARAALREAKFELDAKQISPSEYEITENSLMKIINAPHTPSARKSFAHLSEISHTKLPLVPPSGMPVDLVDESPPGYYTPTHEDEYLHTLDNYLASAPPDSLALRPRQPRFTEKEQEREAQLRNPVSVYNWLRAHADSKPSPHDVEKEAAPPTTNTIESSSCKAKPSPKPPSSTGMGSTKPSRKRASSALIPKQEPEEELLDEEGYVIAGGNDAYATKGKRKRESDDAYRPKGGSSKSRKRTKGSSGVAMKKLEPELEEEDEEEDM